LKNVDINLLHCCGHGKNRHTTKNTKKKRREKKKERKKEVGVVEIGREEKKRHI
jgi:hypothetical protein